MAIEVKHLTQAAGADANNGEIHKTEWNENHPITGTAGAGIRFDVSGDAEEVAAAFAQLSDTTDQVPPTANTATLVTFDTEDEREDITHAGGTITVQTGGVYEFVAGAQVAKASGGTEREVDMWFRKNDIDVPNSAARESVTNTETAVLLLSIAGRFAIGDTIKVYMTVDNTGGAPGLYSLPAGVGPAIPSIILSALRSG